MTRHLHERVAAWGWLRGKLRGAYLKLLRQALATDEGREILHESLDGRVVQTLDPRWLNAAEWPPYADLPSAAPVPIGGPRPIFITGRFRSGTTALWNVFRHAPGFTAYYEPLNERRWFDPAARGERLDSSHREVSDYWSEYDGISGLDELFDPHWHDRRLAMDATSWAPRLKQYLDRLIDAAPGRPVLQFNRIDFRLDWIRRAYPDAILLHLYRHPRDQWLSTLGGAANCSTGAARDMSLAEYFSRDGFYLATWANDLKYRYGFLDPAEHRRPYLLYYLIWKMSYLAGRATADRSLAIESLWRDPAGVLEDLFARLDAPAADARRLTQRIVPQQEGKWRAVADETWFLEQETAAETILAQHLPGLPQRHMLQEGVATHD